MKLKFILDLDGASLYYLLIAGLASFFHGQKKAEKNGNEKIGVKKNGKN